MARLLRDLDYLRVIQSDNLTQIIESNQQTKLDVEQSAQAEMISYLTQRYRVKDVFSNTSVFDIAASYGGKSLVEFTAIAYSATATYSIHVYTLYNGNVYKSNTAIGAPEAFTTAHWDFVCLDRSLFYITLPYSEYDPTVTYSIGTQIWFNGHNYINIKKCINIDPTITEFWTDNGVYTVTAIYPTDATKWTAGDNRNQQIVLFLIDITLYHLHSRINPRNIPDLRKERYNGNSPTDSGGAIGWLKSVAKGNVNADLPEYLTQQGMSMRTGNAGTYDTPSNNMMW